MEFGNLFRAYPFGHGEYLAPRSDATIVDAPYAVDSARCQPLAGLLVDRKSTTHRNYHKV
jgi:hypothetical protein